MASRERIGGFLGYVWS